MNWADRAGRGRVSHLRLSYAEGEAPPFVFDCRIPGIYHLRLIDRRTLVGYLGVGREGDYQEVGGVILWVEPADVHAPDWAG